MTVTNDGAVAVDGVTVIDRLPAHVAVTAVRAGQGGCTAGLHGHKGTVTCGLGRLAPRGTATVALDVIPERPGMLVNVVRRDGKRLGGLLDAHRAPTCLTILASAPISPRPRRLNM